MKKNCIALGLIALFSFSINASSNNRQMIEKVCSTMCFDKNGNEVPSIPMKFNASSCDKFKNNDDKYDACYANLLKSGKGFYGPHCPKGAYVMDFKTQKLVLERK